jgi:hypothetical protein
LDTLAAEEKLEEQRLALAMKEKATQARTFRFLFCFCCYLWFESSSFTLVTLVVFFASFCFVHDLDLGLEIGFQEEIQKKLIETARLRKQLEEEEAQALEEEKRLERKLNEASFHHLFSPDFHRKL